MTGAGLLGLLLLKHAVLAHFIDFGYSASRRSGCRHWHLALFLQCLAEMVGTLYVLSNYSLSAVTLGLLIECAGLTVTTVLEREAPLNRLLGRHIQCEVAMLAVYCLIVGFLVLTT